MRLHAMLIALGLALSPSARADDMPPPDLHKLFVAAGWIGESDAIATVNSRPYGPASAAALSSELRGATEFTIEIAGPATSTRTVRHRLDAPPRDPAEFSHDAELDDMDRQLKLAPLQRAAVKKIIAQGQDDFDRKLIEAQDAGVHDLTAIEKIGQEIADQVKQRMLPLLYAEQRAAFEEYLRAVEGGDEHEHEHEREHEKAPGR